MREFLPKNFDNLVKRIFSFFKGITILFCCMFFFIALLSYNAFDESFNTASTHPISNKLGIIGSYSADFFMQYLGYSSFYAISLFFIYGIMHVVDRKLTSFKYFFVFSLLSSIFFGLFLNIAFLIHGGLIPYIITRKMLFILDYYNFRYLIIFISIAELLISIVLMFKALGTSMKDVRNLIMMIIDKCNMIINGFKQEHKNMFSAPNPENGNSEKNLTNLIKTNKTSKTKKEHLDETDGYVTQEGELTISDEVLESDVFILPGTELLDTVQSLSKDKGPSENELNENG